MQCRHRHWELELATGQRRCLSCGMVLGSEDTDTERPPPRRSVRTLFELRGRVWFVVGVGALFGAAIYVVLRVLP